MLYDSAEDLAWQTILASLSGFWKVWVAITTSEYLNPKRSKRMKLGFLLLSRSVNRDKYPVHFLLFLAHFPTRVMTRDWGGEGR